MKVLTDEEVGTHLNIVDNIMSVHSHEDISLSFHAVFDSHKLANAKIAEQSAEIERLKEYGTDYDWTTIAECEQEVIKLKAEIERLKAATLTCEACGNPTCACGTVSESSRSHDD